jgi:type I restriction enzyme S subunit
MSNGWQTARIGEVVKPIERAEEPQIGITYRQVGVRLWGQGAYERESIDGSQTKYATLSRIESGDIIVNKIWARNGSVAVVTDELAGCFGSGEFPTFAPDRNKLEPKWFHWITKTRWFWEACDKKSQGTSGKNRIRPEKFLEIEIPLPPLTEQRRIVAHIESLARRVNEAQRLREEAREGTEALLHSLMRQIFKPDGAKIVPLETTCAAIIDNLHSNPDYSGDCVVPCIRSSDVGWGA